MYRKLRSFSHRFILCLFLGVTIGISVSCDYLQPRVVVVNKTAEHILIKDPCFNGTIWNMVLAYGESTPQRQCLSGSGNVHFKKFDAFQYCRKQKEGTIDSLCDCSDAKVIRDSGLINTTPFFFNYQTVSTIDAESNDLVIIELKLDDMEQDFSVPGPYAH